MLPQKTPQSATPLHTSLDTLQTALRASNPDQTDKLIEASLASLLGSKPVPLWEDRVTNAGWEGVVTRYVIPANLSPETLAKAVVLTRQSLTAMSLSDCIGLLGELKLLTVARPEQGHDLEAQLSLYAKKLMDYPADVTRKVLTTQPNLSKWWPTWIELKDRLDLYSQRRRRLLDAMTAPQSPPHSGAKAPLYRPAEKSAFEKKVDEAVLARRQRKAEADKELDRSPEDLERELAEQKAKYANNTMAS